MEACAVAAQEYDVDHIFNDLAEGQGYDGQVVALQTKYRNTDQEAEQRGYCSSHQKCQEEPKPRRVNHVSRDLGKQRSGKGSGAHEARVSQTQLSQDTYGQVQGDGQNHVYAQGNQKSL